MLRETLIPLQDALALAVMHNQPLSIPATKTAALVLAGIAAELEKLETSIAEISREPMPPADALPHVWLRWLGNTFSQTAREEGEMYLDRDTLCALALLFHNQGSRSITLARAAGHEILPPRPVVAPDQMGGVVPLPERTMTRGLMIGLDEPQPGGSAA